ncbi:TlpA disulfide reductase family protein [Porifericola rhodea]|uniref:TlpA family protein disulfide reductase n=1 Tax=Porifericola rhodea TaxID=930972 RepID=UPI00266593A1|nr:TlpA disulfide reductase family protein [Porifericola rhodea]WKN31937.1 TlpA disulfide reductase family protein [Porifericola rhodea]
MIKINIYTAAWIMAFLLLVACNANTQKDEGNTAKNTRQEQANPLALVQLEDLEGNTIALDHYKDKTVVLNFWATWCKPCVVEMPSMEQAKEQLGDDFVFLLASDEGVEKISAFKEKIGVDLPFVSLKMSMQNLPITALPTTWIIRNGEILEEIVGSREWDEAAHLENLKQL